MVTEKKSKRRPPKKKLEAFQADDGIGDRIARTTAPRQLDDPIKRAQWNLPDLDSPDETGSYIIELNVQHALGLAGAAHDFIGLYDRVVRPDERPGKPRTKANSPGVRNRVPLQIAKSYFRCDFKEQEWRRIVGLDEQKPMSERAIYRIWPDFPVKANTDRSVATIKGDAALRSFAATGEQITWAVIDSGVDASHPHFGRGDRGPDRQNHALLSKEVADLHRSFSSIHEEVKGSFLDKGVLASPDWDPALTADQRDKLMDEHRKWALSDHYGHGTHVAGIIAGEAPGGGIDICALERQYTMDAEGGKASQSFGERSLSNTKPRGVAPKCKIISLRVLDRLGKGRSSDVIQALEYLREKINDNPKLMRVHGVNLSVGYEFDPEMFAAGQSPLCVAVDRLVQEGVVVVVAAGNTGFGTVAVGIHTTSLGISNSINDPGNASQAITVGSTHRDSPHTYGVSYFSSKGPTGDGRLKPDLVAPGERITSCAAGEKLAQALVDSKRDINGNVAYYVDDSGTSMAAPHVSGAIAAFLSVRREFIGKPLEVKRIFLDSATPLGRERYFEGHGLVDLMRALQLV
ncbi:peptidase S8 [Candidimonas sp. SYP-B2681]|uniref:S8 family peptidase n=1 Tax=Candidimonas sp. SYP-B2681 TaxID=2497686 RepID=UPI000F89C873|nr:S8 family peptidase [Candidimonas sp. SYP-B2681]RTZ40010.1 peptidase S8 [Candidimonas sp. SYP-B2681]